MKLTLSIFLVVLMAASSAGVNDTEQKALVPVFLRNIIDYCTRLSAFLEDPKVDEEIRALETKFQGGAGEMGKKLKQCAIKGFFQYMYNNKDAQLGQIGSAMSVTESSGDQVIKNPLMLMGMITGLITKLPEMTISWDKIWTELKTILSSEIPRYCSRDENFSKDIEGIREIFRKMDDIGSPSEAKPGE